MLSLGGKRVVQVILPSKHYHIPLEKTAGAEHRTTAYTTVKTALASGLSLLPPSITIEISTLFCLSTIFRHEADCNPQ